MSSAMYSVSKYGCWNASCSKSATPSSSLEFGPYHHPLACGLRGLPRASASLSACSEFLCKFASGWGGRDDGISALLLPVSLVAICQGWTFHWHLSPKPWLPL